VRQNMAVTGAQFWDVAALIGTDLQIFTLTRDLDVEVVMVEAARHFWETYVLADVAPPEDDPARRKALASALYPRNVDKICVAPSDPERYAEACRRFMEASEAIKAAEA